MWVVGDWGQDSPWSRDTGVKMVKGANDVYTGELSLPKGTKFDIRILKADGGENTWSAARYASTLNTSTSHGFGEFTDNLIPNSNFDEGQVRWTPAECASSKEGTPAVSKPGVLCVGGSDFPTSCVSDVFVLPPNQTLRLTGYVRTFDGVATMKVVTPQQQILFELSNDGDHKGNWTPFSRTFKTGDVPMECQIVLSNKITTDVWAEFDSLSLVSP